MYRILNIPSTWNGLSVAQFQNDVDLLEVNLPDDCTFLNWVNATGGYHAFEGCTGLERIKLPWNNSQFTFLPSGFFYGCTSLQKIYIPSSVVQILSGTGPFYGCDNLKYIDCRDHAQVITATGDQSLNFFDSSPECKILVANDDDLLQQWRAANYWSTYSDKIIKYIDYYE